MKFIGVDFETSYSSKLGLTLKKMTTEEYIRHPQFRPLVVGIHDPEHGGAIAWPMGDAAVRKLQSYDWSDTAVVCWNAHFDGAILAWHFGIRPRAVICAMAMWRMMGLSVHGGHVVGGSLSAATKAAKSMGWPVVDKGNEVLMADGKLELSHFSSDELHAYVKYCRDDAYNAYVLFEGMMNMGFPASELVPLSESIRCFTEPRIVLNTDKLRVINERKKWAQQEAMNAAGVADIGELRSDDKMAEMLRVLGVEPPTKINAKGVTKYAFSKADEAFQDLLEHEDDTVATLVEARLETKSTITVSRTGRLIGISQRGRWPIMLLSGQAHTLRLAGADATNPQNVSKKDGTRDAMEVPEGFRHVVGDLSQIEARLVAYIAGESKVVEAFRAKRDLYCEFANASGVFDKLVTKQTVDERFLAKGVVLGGGFGAGAGAMEKQVRNLAFNLGLKIDLEVDWPALNRAYRTQNPRIVELWHKTQAALEALVAGEHQQFGTDGLVHYRSDGRGPRFVFPNGLAIWYHRLDWDEVDNTRVPGTKKMELHFDYARGRAAVRKRIYGPKACVDGSALTLTNRGWVPLRDVSTDDLVHDGVEFVRHEGLLNQGVRACVLVDGVAMTHDHEVLTNEGWVAASQGPRPYRPDLLSVGFTHSGGAAARCLSEHRVQQASSRPVYDLLNCGPRHRFVVLGDEGPFVVHNCENYVQGLAGLLIREKWAAIVKRARKELGLKYGPIVLQCHDELLSMVRTEVVDDYAALKLEELRKPPAWAPNIPLDAEVAVGSTYAEAK